MVQTLDQFDLPALDQPLEGGEGTDMASEAERHAASVLGKTLEQHALFHILLQAQPQLRAFVCQHNSGCTSENSPVELLAY